MPELPEVETTRRGLEPRMTGRKIAAVIVREPRLRQRVPRRLAKVAAGAAIHGVGRRAKYLLVATDRGTLIVHLGMSGRLWIVDRATPPATHDHVDLVLDDGTVIRLRDPRRFGLVLWQTGDVLTHPLLADIGPEPLSLAFNGDALHVAVRNRSAAIKLVLMDAHVVAGVGNIYANEALFRAGIRPGTAARRVSRARCAVLVEKVREVLAEAIAAGGSSLRDYVGSDGEAGFFQDRFMVYDRAGEPCLKCATTIRAIRQGQRATYYCPQCQR
jgi:formamidopyrimidine-DNA glycosylase